MTSPTAPSTLTSPSAARVDEVKIACPSCGSTKVTLDYDATVSLRVVDGVVEAVLVGGIFGVRPTNFFCEDCDHQPFPADEATDTALSQVEGTLPDTIEGDLNEGWYMFGDAAAL